MFFISWTSLFLAYIYSVHCLSLHFYFGQWILCEWESELTFWILLHIFFFLFKKHHYLIICLLFCFWTFVYFSKLLLDFIFSWINFRIDQLHHWKISKICYWIIGILHYYFIYNCFEMYREYYHLIIVYYLLASNYL